MKTTVVLISLITGASLLVTTGCKKSETPPAPPAPTTSEAGQDIGTAAKDAAAQAQKAGEQVVKDAAAQATTAAAAVNAQAQGLIDKAKSLIADKKYQDALTSLQGLTGMKLTAEQQSLVDSLKAQIQKALAAPAVTVPAVPGIPGGTK